MDTYHEDDRWLADLLEDAIVAWGISSDRDAAALDTLVPRLPIVQEIADQLLDDRLDDLWVRGWTPTDLVHVVGRRLAQAHVAVLAGHVVADGRRRMAAGQPLHPRWHEQVAVLDGMGGPARPPRPNDRLRLGIDILAAIRRLPDLPASMPPPGDALAEASAALRRMDGQTLRRVRALLAKAESTDFEEEAQALTAKAQELMARHSIDEALLHAGDRQVGEPSLRRILLDDPYIDAKASVVSAVARANRCSAVLQTGLGWVHVLGYEHDLDTVELLSTSLLAQATTAMVREGSRWDHTGTSRTRSYRRGFLYGFANRVGVRLKRAADAQVAEAAEHADGSLLPVLASREDRIVAAERKAFPNLRTRRSSPVNADGWDDGVRAGDRANLGAPAGRLSGSS